MQKFFSICIPIYNAERYLDECIKSIFMQTENNYEVLLVDDGSTDKSLEICRQWGKKYPEQIRIFENKNQGSLLARRTGLENSNGKYLYVMDADDYLVDMYALEKLRRTIEEYQCDMVIFNITRDEVNKTKFYKYPFKNKEVFFKETLVKVYDEILNGSTLNTLWNKVFSREILDDGTDYRECPLNNGTDFYQVLPILSAARKIVYLDEILYFYRETEGSIVNIFKPQRYISVKINLNRKINFVRKWKYKPENLDEKIQIGALKTISSAAYKIKMLPISKVKIATTYLSEIREDVFFNENYERKILKKIPTKYRVILELLNTKSYFVLFFCIRISDRLKNIIRE